MNNARYSDNEHKGTLSRSGSRRDSSPPVMLAALREAEVAYWNASGGDHLDRRFQSAQSTQFTRRQAIRGALWAFSAGLAATLLAGCTGSNAQSPSAAVPPPEVPVHRVIARPVPVQFEFTGQSAASHQVDVRARVGGYVVNVPYAEGEFVEAGTLLFEIDSRAYVAVHAKAEAEVARAKAAFKLARQELERAERLAAGDAIAVEELQRRRTDAETAGALLAGAIAQREAAALDVEFTKVKAPVAGRVSRSLVRPGNLISGGDDSGTLLTTLVATTPLHVLFNVDEPAYRQLTDLRTIGTSLRAEVTLGGQGPSADGKLDYLAPSIDGRSGTAQARVILPNPDGRLAPGMFARVTVIADTPEPRLLIPETAIGARQGTRYVLVVNQDNQVTARTVVLGERHGNDRVVTGGLAPGETLVINGLQRIHPDMTVQPVEAAIAAN
jgi:RND family efflux transporter MFP subunit